MSFILILNKMISCVPVHGAKKRMNIASLKKKRVEGQIVAKGKGIFGA